MLITHGQDCQASMLFELRAGVLLASNPAGELTSDGDLSSGERVPGLYLAVYRLTGPGQVRMLPEGITFVVVVA